LKRIKKAFRIYFCESVKDFALLNSTFILSQDYTCAISIISRESP